jgi:hypothetical protein
LTLTETVALCVIVVAGTVAAIFGVLEGTALAGLLGAALGYGGKGVVESKREHE